MNIVFVSYEFPPQFGGGIGTYVEAMTRILARRGHSVTVVTVCADSVPSRECVNGLTIVRLAMPAPRGAEPMATLEFWRERSEQVADCVAGLVRAGRAEIVEFADYRGEGLAYLSRTRPGQRPPCIARLHTSLAVLDKYNAGRAQGPLLAAFENEAMARADHLVSPSAALAREVRALVPGLAERLIDIHPYPAPLATMGWEALAGRTGGRDILYVGRMEERKGVLTLLSAAPGVLRRCPTARLRLVGGDTALNEREPSVRAVLQRMAPADVGNRIVFENAMPREHLTERYLDARVCVFPSLFENFPNVCLEAMGLGRVVVVGDNTGMAEMVEDGRSGFVCASGDARALEDALVRAFESADGERERMGREAWERVRTAYDPEKIAGQFEALCEGYLGANSAVVRRPARAPRASVGAVVPCFNHGRYLPEAIASLKAQSVSVVEIVIVDDGSTDAETRRVLGAMQREGARVIHQKNQGLAAARNTGVRALGTDFYVALDSDDRLAPQFVEKLLRPLVEDGGLGYCYCWAEYFGDSHGVWHCPPYDARRLLVENMSTATAVVRTEAFHAAGGYQADMLHGFEDWDFWIALLSQGYHGRLVAEPLFFYRKHAGGSMLSRTQQRRGEMMQRMVEHHARLFERNAVFALTMKDAMFFREHMELWRLREAGHAGGQPPVDQPVDTALPSPAEAELARIEASRAWQLAGRVKQTAIYDALARARWGPGWRLVDLKDGPDARLSRIKASRTYRLIEAMKRSALYRAYAGRREK